MTADASLEKLINSGRFCHGYLITGPRGTGKKALAARAAKAMLCESADGKKPCGACSACRTFDGGNHPDAVFIAPDKKSSISAEFVRENVISAAYVRPYRAAVKVFIVDKAELLTPAAQNILLKTLEEPPPYGVFLLCAQGETWLLPTVRSRLWRVKVLPLPPHDAAAALLQKRPDLSHDQALFFAHLSGGSVGLAVELSEPDEDGTPPAIRAREALFSILDGIGQKTSARILLETKALEPFKDAAGMLFTLMELWYRDLAVKDFGEICLADMRDRIAAAEPCHNLSFCMDEIAKARERLMFNAGFALTIEVLMLTLGGKILDGQSY